MLKKSFFLVEDPFTPNPPPLKKEKHSRVKARKCFAKYGKDAKIAIILILVGIGLDPGVIYLSVNNFK